MNRGWGDTDSEEGSDLSSGGGEVALQPSFLERFQELKFQALTREALKEAKRLSQDPRNPRCPICTLHLSRCLKPEDHQETIRRRKAEAEAEEGRAKAEALARRELEDGEASDGRSGSPRGRPRSPRGPKGPRPKAGPSGRGARLKKAGPRGEERNSAGETFGGPEDRFESAEEAAARQERSLRLSKYQEEKARAKEEAEQEKLEKALQKKFALREKEAQRQARGRELKEKLIRMAEEKEKKMEESAKQKSEAMKEAKKKEDMRRRNLEQQRLEVGEWRAKKEEEVMRSAAAVTKNAPTAGGQGEYRQGPSPRGVYHHGSQSSAAREEIALHNTYGL